ncbi:MAG: hypothetical protein ABI867_21485 [Kofleriaceae bacterium]
MRLEVLPPRRRPQRAWIVVVLVLVGITAQGGYRAITGTANADHVASR